MTEPAQIASRAQALIEAGQPDQAEALLIPFLGTGQGPIILNPRVGRLLGL
jgi:hypothetical protein